MKQFRILLAIFLCLVLVPVLSAQISTRETGSIRGVVVDNEGNHLPGVSIKVTGPALLGTASAMTNEEGAYRVTLLPVGTYTLIAELQGFTTFRREGIVVTLGSSVTVNIEATLSPVAEEITVVGQAPIVDVRTSAVSQTLKSEMLQNLPISRTLTAVVTLAPGVVAWNQIHGGTTANTIFNVDGLYANDPDQAQLGINIDFNIMEEVEVVTGGLPAEMGIATGGFVNVVTKSGGNAFSGLFQAFYDSEKFTTIVLPEVQLSAMGLGKPAVAIYTYDVSGGVGGPILKDKLWFYVNSRHGANVTRSGFKPWTDPRGVSYEEFNREGWNWGAFLKLTFQPFKNVKMSFNGNARQAFVNTRAGGLFMPFDCHYRDNPWANYTATGIATWIVNPNTFVEVRAGLLNVDAMLTLVRPELETVPYMYDSFTGYYFGTGYRPNEWVGRPSSQASIHLTRFQDNFLGGDHEFKTGFEVVTGASTWASWKEEPIYWEWYNGNPYYYRGLYGLTGPHPIFGDGYIGFRVYGTTREGSEAVGENLRLSAYLQDSFTFKQRLTVNAGIRFDQTTGKIPRVYKNRSGGISEAVGAATILPVYGINPFAEIKQAGIDKLIE